MVTSRLKTSRISDPTEHSRNIQQKLRRALRRLLVRQTRNLYDARFLSQAGERMILNLQRAELLAEVEIHGFTYVLVRFPETPTDGLTRREKQVAQLVGAGFANRTIATRLGISQFTVATHLQRVYRKLGIHSRAALAHGMLKIEPPRRPTRPGGSRREPRLRF